MEYGNLNYLETKFMNAKEKIWIDALIIIAKILKGNNVSYFLDMGTLLGAIRDKSFIPWDNDIDIGVNPEKEPTREYIRELSDKIYKEGFNITSTSSKICIKKKYTDIEINIQFYKNDLKYYYFIEEFVDASKHKFIALIHSHIFNKIIFKKGHNIEFKGLVFLSKILETLTLLIPRKTLNFLFKKVSILDYNVKVPKNLINEYVEYSFYDELFLVPKEYKTYLGYRYGDWNKKVKDYNFLIDDRAVL